VSRTDPDGDDKAQQKREEREKEPEQELEEGLDISRLIGNALRASLGSGSMGATIDLAGPRRGDPGDVEDLGGPAAPPDGPEDVVIDTLGDPEWSPPPRPAGPLIAPSERLASPELRDARMNLVEDRAESADAGEDAWRVPTGDTVATALRPWAVAASRLAGDDEPGRMLAWWAGHGCTTLTSPAARPLVACALASLAWARNGDDDDASRAVRVALEAGRARIEAAEHHWTLAGGGVPTAASLVGTALSASDLPPPPAEPPADLTEASAFWREALALRPGRTWRAQHHGPPDSTPDDVITRLIGPGAVEPADRRREHVAELGIGLFRELIRHRVRVSAAAVVLADAVLPMMYADVHPGLIDLVARVDQVTQDGLTTLHRLGRGLHLKPYLDDATARAMVDLVAGSVDRAAAAWVRQLATLTAHALGGADLAQLPPGNADPLHAALRAGRPDRLVLLDPVAAALRPPLSVASLRSAADEGPTGAALELLALLVSPSPEAAHRQAERVAEIARARGNAALLAAAAWLGADAAARQGHDPEPALLAAATRLYELGEAPWAERLVSWAPG
jgi:hypothetical protein